MTSREYHLSEFWDALICNDVPPPPDNENEEESIVRYVDMARSMELPAVRHARIWKQIGLAGSDAVNQSSGSVSGQVIVGPWRSWQSIDRRRPSGRLLSWLAIAAAILILVLGGAFAGIAWEERNYSQGSPPALVPAASGTLTEPRSQFQLSSTPKLLWSSTGTEDSPLYMPVDVKVAPDGNVWVYDNGDQAIHVFSPDGEFIESWGDFGGGNWDVTIGGGVGDEYFGGFDFGPDGSVFVTDIGNFRIQKFDADHNLITEWGTEGDGDSQFDQIADVAVGTNGLVYVLDFNRHDVQVFDQDGAFQYGFTPLKASGSPMRDARRITAAPDGRVWVSPCCGPNMATGYSASGQFEVTLDGDIPGAANAATGGKEIAFDAASSLYIANEDPQLVFVVDEQSTLLGSWEIAPPEYDGIYYPFAIAPDNQGFIYVTTFGYTGGGRLLKYQM